MNATASTIEYVREFFRGVEEEFAADIPVTTRRALDAYYVPAGLLNTWRKSYFYYHYTEPVARALQYLVLERSSSPPTILDLGCGTGTQSLIFASQGARVIAFDMDQPALDVLSARKVWYEKKLGRSLDITPVYGNALEHDLGAYGKLDGIYSLFAFNMMQPSNKLLDRLSQHLQPNGRLAIQDGNRLSVYNSTSSRRRNVLSPEQFHHELEQRAFGVQFRQVTGCLPPLLCALTPTFCQHWLHHTFRRNWRIGVSYQIMAGRTDA